MTPPSESELVSYRSSLSLCGTLLLAYSALFIAFGLLFALVGTLGGLGILDPHDTLEERLGGGFVAAVITLFMFVMGALNVTAGIGLRRTRPWAKNVGLATGILDVIAGCGCILSWALCIWLIVLLVDRRAEVVFAAPSPE